ncbi:tyrosine-type recombinase/integrase [Cerasicoccus arenae]|uniref:tyrosine-type recombinase/integrase n=1 Tax=Cerasicoccus arenae TaxID=424488 RepID=UPI001671E888|nr:site-specific integrase [Cerasicoccus arenae]MBK1857785.1 site-specific integrase [Cerasicoccus arenae]
MHLPIQLRDRQGRRKYLTPDERRIFFNHTKTLSTRNRLFCQTLYYTGCRLSEALALGEFSADVEGKVITFKTLKRHGHEHQRSVPVPNEHVKEVRSLGKCPFPYSRTTAWRIIKKAMAGAGINGPQATPRGLRHGFAIKCATENAVISKIQVWMGHASPMTTMIYLDAVGAEERDFIRRTWD